MKKVLVIDDDPGMMDAFSMLFKRAGYDTTVLSSARSILEGNYEVPDIFVLDRQLSGADGIDVCRYLKSSEFTRGIPVVIVSASPHVATLAEQAGANAFLEKPFSNKDLLRLVEKLLVT